MAELEQQLMQATKEAALLKVDSTAFAYYPHYIMFIPNHATQFVIVFRTITIRFIIESSASVQL